MKPKLVKDSKFNIFYIEKATFNDERGLISKFFSDFMSVKESTITVAKKGSIRGMHYQIKKPQMKIVYVLSGKILDVCVSTNCATAGPEVFSKILGAGEGIMISDEFAHGFQSLEESEILMFYSEETFPEYSRGFSIFSKCIEKIWKTDSKQIVSKNDLSMKRLEDEKL